MPANGLNVRKPLIVVVDDEEPLRRLLRSMLTVSGFRVLLASSGHDALRIAAAFRRHIDLMITDVQLPGCSGFVVAEKLERIRPEMPVLFMSGSVNEADCDSAGWLRPGREFIEKPFTSKALAAKINRLLSSSIHGTGFQRSLAEAAACQE